MDLTPRSKSIYLNNFDGDILSDINEESLLDYKDTKDGKAELNKPKESSYNKWTH